MKNIDKEFDEFIIKESGEDIFISHKKLPKEKIKAFYNQKIKEMVDRMVGKVQHGDEADRLMKETTIMAGHSHEERYPVCISRVYGYNQKRQEIINIVKEYDKDLDNK